MPISGKPEIGGPGMMCLKREATLLLCRLADDAEICALSLD